MKALRLHNHEPVVFSSSAASAGGHATLAHVPGSALWGAAAAKVYARDDAQGAFVEVHSGDLRFSAAFPLSRGHPAFPMPHTFQEPKHEKGGLADGILTTAVWNMADRGVADLKSGPGEALKGYYLAADHSVVRPRRMDRGKTAIVEGERLAADSQFFQYEYLAAGQDWLAWIDGPAELCERASASMIGDGIRLGRSGLKEFGGGFRIELADAPDSRAGQWTETLAAGDALILWCLTDMALTDSYGMPDLAPDLSTLVGEPRTERLAPGRSTITTRRYAPYNAYLRALDREHAVIEAGSVLVYDLEQPLELGRFRSGIGQWRERGLGMVWPNAPMLMELRPAKATPAPAKAAPASESKLRSDTPGSMDDPRPALDKDERHVRERAEARTAERGELEGIGVDANLVHERLGKIIKVAIGHGQDPPSASQWSLIAREAENSGDLNALKAVLLGKGGACVGPANPEWEPLRKTLEEIIDKGVNLRAFARAAWRLAAEARQ